MELKEGSNVEKLSTATQVLEPQARQQGRKLDYRTSGHKQGPVARLMSPSDVGEMIKPFVFLDLFGFDSRLAPMPMDVLWHPHSGIATVTVMLEGEVRYADTIGKEGVLPAGGVEWMRASNGVWHTGEAKGRAKGFQLWVALPPELENAANASHYVAPKDVPDEGPARVILGAYGKAKRPVAAPPMTYLAVNLKDGERWTYQPPAGHDVPWATTRCTRMRRRCGRVRRRSGGSAGSCAPSGR